MEDNHLNFDRKSVNFKFIDVMWLFTVDLLNPIGDMKSVVKKVRKSYFCGTSLRYYGIDELETVKAVPEIKPEKGKEHDFLNIFSKADFHNFDDEYLENQNFSRFKLKNLKVKFPFNQKLNKDYYDCEVLLTISKLGIAVFTFWVHIESDLTSQDIADLQILNKENREVQVEVPIELIRELSYLKSGYSELYNYLKSNNKEYIDLERNFISINFLYWFSLLNVLSTSIHSLKLKRRKYETKSFQEFKDKLDSDNELRYEVQGIFPIVIVHSSDPEYEHADIFIQKAPKQFYQILSHINYDYNLIYSDDDSLNLILKPNLTERRDFAYLDALGSVLLIFGSEIDKSMKDYYILEAFIIVEFLQIQRFYLSLLIKALDQPIAEMSPRRISVTRSYLSQALSMYYSKVAGNSEAIRRLEHGKDIMGLEEDFKIINQKIELLGEALNSFSTLKTSVFEIFITVIVGLLSAFLVFFNTENEVLSFYSGLIFIIIIVMLILTFTLASKYIWRRLRSKKIKHT